MKSNVVNIAAIIITVLLLACKSVPKSDAKMLFVTALDIDQLQRHTINCSVRAILPLDKKTCWYAGSRGQYGYTEDGGLTWSIDSLQHPDQDELQFRSIAEANGCIFLLSIASPALLYKTNDKGKHWDIVYRENDSLVFYDAMAFWDDKHGIAMGDPIGGCLSIIKTSDGGNNWDKIPCHKLPRTVDGEAAFAASNSNISLYRNHVWIVSGGMKTRVFHSADQGESWEVFDTPIVQGGKMTGIFSCDFFDEKTGIIIGGNWEDKENKNANKAITTDGGMTWTLVADGLDPSYRSCVQYVGSKPTDLIAVGIPGISVSSDGGRRWTNISEESFYTVRELGNIFWFGGANKLGRLSLE